MEGSHRSVIRRGLIYARMKEPPRRADVSLCAPIFLNAVRYTTSRLVSFAEDFGDIKATASLGPLIFTDRFLRAASRLHAAAATKASHFTPSWNSCCSAAHWLRRDRRPHDILLFALVGEAFIRSFDDADDVFASPAANVRHDITLLGWLIDGIAWFESLHARQSYGSKVSLP